MDTRQTTTTHDVERSQATTPSVNDLSDLSNWISLAEAAARLPSPRAGKRTHVTTVYQLARKHGLTVLRRGPWKFVHWPSVLAMFQPMVVVNVEPTQRRDGARRTLAQERATSVALRQAGLA